MNGLNNFDQTDREYSLAPTDDLVICWRSKVEVAPWFKYVGGEGIHVDAGLLTSIF